MRQNNGEVVSPALEVKGSVLTIITLHITETQPDRLYPQLEKKFGINPYKFGVGGATDSHTALATAAAPTVIPSSAFGLAGNTAPSERITMGTIGVGGRGTHDMQALMENQDVQMVAVTEIERMYFQQLANLAQSDQGFTEAVIAEAIAGTNRVLGDSISLGYTPFVKTMMKDEANIIHNKGNAQHPDDPGAAATAADGFLQEWLK